MPPSVGQAAPTGDEMLQQSQRRVCKSSGEPYSSAPLYCTILPLIPLCKPPLILLPSSTPSTPSSAAMPEIPTSTPRASFATLVHHIYCTRLVPIGPVLAVSVSLQSQHRISPVNGEGERKQFVRWGYLLLHYVSN